ncbi:hypothetical protein SAMN05216221_0546 [Pseudomonas oryzae]|uniref:Uncharacterized protein n=1 Tax=Pseudomonas oryzae TaxID=1392877 RepID=A0A1H1MLU2_9PSED|nr:hypothetical protein SAMN05216221_0546 [Pseudomonas oryzae]
MARMHHVHSLHPLATGEIPAQGATVQLSTFCRAGVTLCCRQGDSPAGERWRAGAGHARDLHAAEDQSACRPCPPQCLGRDPGHRQAESRNDPGAWCRGCKGISFEHPDANTARAVYERLQSRDSNRSPDDTAPARFPRKVAACRKQGGTGPSSAFLPGQEWRESDFCGEDQERADPGRTQAVGSLQNARLDEQGSGRPSAGLTPCTHGQAEHFGQMRLIQGERNDDAE